MGLTVGCGSSIYTIPSALSLESDSTSAASVGSPYVASAQIGSDPVREVPSSFMGMSLEWGTAQTVMGSTATGIDLPFRQLLTNLTAYGSGPFILRIGGNSTDKTTAPTDSTVEPFAELAKAMNVKFYLGLNLGSDDPQLAAVQAQNYLDHMPVDSIDAFEIGNEPENYPGEHMRPPTYKFPDYLNDFNAWRTALRSSGVNSVTLMGPSWSRMTMFKNMPAFVADEKSSVGIVSGHYYAGTICNNNNEPNDFLLSPAAADSGPASLVSSVQTTHASGLPFRVDEMNSISCGGEPSVSDTFSASLWMLDSMFELANIGVDGVNVHQGNGGPYALFSIGITTDAEGLKTYAIHSVAPSYYGLLVFQQATGNGAWLLPVTMKTNADVKVWATTDSAGTTRVVVINKDQAEAGTIALTLPGYKSATVARLTAPGWQSTSGVTFASQTFDGSTTGVIIGTKSLETITGSNNTYLINMPVTSAALLTFSE